MASNRSSSLKKKITPAINANFIDVNPLFVTGCIREQVNQFLVDRHPFADVYFLSDPALQVCQNFQIKAFYTHFQLLSLRKCASR